MLSPGKDSLDSWQVVIDELPDPLWFVAGDLDTAMMNAACMLLLASERMVAVSDFFDRVSEPERPAVHAAWSASRANCSGFDVECRMEVAGGGYRHTNLRGSWHGNGSEVHFVGSLRDSEEMHLSRDREALLVASNGAFSAHDDPDELIEALLAIIVPAYADYAVIDLFNADGSFDRFAFAGPEATRIALAQTRERYARDGAPVGSSWHVAQTGEELLVRSDSIPADWPQATRTVHRELGVKSAIVVPLAGNDRRLGALSVVRTDRARDAFRARSVAFYADIAARMATVLERTRTIVALRQSENVYRTLADEMPQLVGLTNPDGSLFYLNRQHAAYTGMTGTMQGWEATIHPDDRPALTAGWLAAVHNGERYETRYRLRRHDGVYRWFLNQAQPVRDASGTIVSWIGTATDIDEHQRREDALRLAVEVGAMFAATLDTRVALQQLADTAARHLADWCGVYLFDADGALQPVAVAHVDPDSVKLVREYLRRYPLGEDDAITKVARTGISERVGPITPEMYDVIDDPDRRAFVQSLGLRAVMNVALMAGKERFGAFSLATSQSGRVFDEDDERTATMLAQRAGIALENARLFERQRDVARTLQAAFLPASLPLVAGVQLDAQYIPGSHDLSIGGDWYDADVRDDGRLTFSIGDVAGHGLDAAIPMGKMRQTFRALPRFAEDPAAASIVADTILRREHPDVFVTAFLGVYDPAANELRYVNAGHPPPFIRLEDGTIERLDSAGVPLGLADVDPPQIRRTLLAPASLLVAFTDGLIEIEHDIDAGERQVETMLRHPAFAICSTPAALLRSLIVPGEALDDIAILTMRNGGGARWTFDSRSADAAHAARRTFVKQLSNWNIEHAIVKACELVLGEAIGNVVRYAPGVMDIGVDRDGDGIVLSILDRGPGFEWKPGRPADSSESGRGLFLIEVLSRRVRCDYLAGFGTYLEIEIGVR